MRRGAAALERRVSPRGRGADRRARRRRRAQRAQHPRAVGRRRRAPRAARSRRATSRTPRASGRSLYDKGGDAHYDSISAWIKSTRAGDVQASVYYLAVMLEGGEDARFIARRMIVLASEDIGNADPQALARRRRGRAGGRARRACPRRGSTSPRPPSTSPARRSRTPRTVALGKATQADVREHGHLHPPAALRSASYPGARSSAAARATSTRTTTRPGFDVDCLPDELKGRVYYEPSGNGEEGSRGSGRRGRSRRARRRAAAVSFASVEDRVHLDQLERVEQARLGDELEREVRLAVGEPAAHGRADAGREHRVDGVEVEARRARTARRRGTRAPRASTRSTPCRSMSLIVNTRDAELARSAPARPRRASGSPTSAARSTDGVGQASRRERRRRPRRARPRAASRARCPLGEVSGRLRSPCASIQSTPPAPRAFAIPPSVPIATEWSPPSTSGRSAWSARLADERRDRARRTCMIAPR